MEGIGKGLGEVMITMCIVTLAVFWGGWELIDWLFIDDAIKTKTLIVPEIEITVKDNVIDTLYIYRKPTH
jgi:hypothetical protein